jgi:hypothetical protein
MNTLIKFLLVLLTLLQSSMAFAQELVLDNFENLSGWSAIASEGARIEIAQDVGHTGMGMRIDFDFQAGGGHVLVHKDLPLKLPENYAFSFYLRAEAPTNHAEFKLIDPSGQNVWWHQKRHFSFPQAWRQVTVKKRHFTFVWGPAGGGELKETGAIEFAISVDKGGKGSVWIDDLQFEKREPVRPYELKPVVRALHPTAKPWP